MGCRWAWGRALSGLYLIVEDKITLDQLSTHSDYDLCELYNEELADNEVNDSPFLSMNNSLEYYEPRNIKTLLANNKNFHSLFCLNTQGLRSHWDNFRTLVDDMNGDTQSGSFDNIIIQYWF